MAKKAKTPRPPVQAPQRRDTQKSGGGVGGLPGWALALIAVAAVAVIVVVVVVVASGGGGGSSSDVKTAMEAAGCTVRDVKPLPPKDGKSFHNDVPSLTAKVKWSTDPPSAGGHYPLWVVWGFYRAPMNPRKVVHNEEHGGVIIWWGSKVPSSTVDQLEQFYRDSPNGMLGTPYPKLGDKIALTAWTGDPSTYYRKGDYGMGHIAICPKFDEDAFKAFRSAYRGKGPEGISESSNTPGSGPG